MREVDPVTLEVVRNALVAYAGEMTTVLRHTAYNTMIFEVQDYCVGLVDPAGDLIAQNEGGLPIFLADLGVAVADGVERYGLEGFERGDAVIMNHPYVCGQHLNNVVVYTPCFVDGEVVAFPAVRAHWVDIGGKRIGFGATDTTDIYQEGLQLRSIKVVKGGEFDPDVLQILTDNVRDPDALHGDLRAQTAACRVGERRLADLYTRYGRDTIEACIREMRNHSEQLARAQVRKIADGEYRASSWLDNDGQNLDRHVSISARVVVEGDELTVDLTDMPDQVTGPINSGSSGGTAAARVAFKALTLPTHPVDEGCFRNLCVQLRPKSLVSAEPPAALGQWSIPLPTLIDTIITALAPGMPDVVPAAHKGDMGGFSLHGYHEGTRWVCMAITDGGWGGRPTEDGPSAAVSVCQGDVRNVPIEVQEARFPLRFSYHQLRSDSGGAGTYRGGLGVHIGFEALSPAWMNVNNERTTCPPWGLNSGEPGATNETYVRQHASADPEFIKKRTGTRLDAGGHAEFLTGGGGGWGDPFARDPAHVLEDVRDGYVSPERACDDYGVAIDEDGEVDLEATRTLRGSREGRRADIE